MSVRKPTAAWEREARRLGYRLIAGADEAGRGSLFGPVFAAAVILSPDRTIRGIQDSKLLPAVSREHLAAEIRSKSLAWAVAGADVYEIDHLNILQASRLAMRRAIGRLSPAPDYLLIDAIKVDSVLPQVALIHGDARCRSIAAASILAKVERDRCLAAWDAVFPEYGLAKNKGYGTPDHLDALRKHGPTFLHRMSFEPVRAAAPAWLIDSGPVQERLFASAEGAS